MHRRMRLWTMVIVLGLCLPLVSTRVNAAQETPTACPEGASGEADGPIRIGVILPLSGTAASVGNDERAALELAAQIVNDDVADLPLPLAAGAGLPNLGGATVELVIADSQGKAEVGQSEATRLIDEGVVALFGAYQSAVTKTASAAAERAGIPYLNAESSSPDLTERDYAYFFRTSPHDGTFSQNIFDFIEMMQSESGAEVNGISLLYEDTDFGVNSAAAEKTQAEERGMTIAGEVKYKANATSLTSEVQALQSQGANILIPSSYTTDAILMMQTAQELGYLPQMIVAQNAGFLDPAFVESVGAANVEGIASRSAFSIDISEVKPAAGVVNERYKAATGKDLYDVPARGFTGMTVLLDAINRACSTDPEGIREALIATDWGQDETIMPWTGVKFDEQGQNELGAGIIVQIQGGQYRTVFPTEFAVAEVVYPLTPWDQR